MGPCNFAAVQMAIVPHIMNVLSTNPAQVAPQAVLAAPAAPQQQLFRQPSMSRSKAAELPSPPLAYEVIQGALVSELQSTVYPDSCSCSS